MMLRVQYPACFDAGMGRGREDINRTTDRSLAQLALLNETLTEHTARGVVIVDPIQGTTTGVVRAIHQPPEDLVFLLKDAVHYMRCALDYLAWRLVEVNGGVPSSSTAFPIGKSTSRYTTLLNERLRGASPEHIAMVDALEPRPGGDERFVDLNEIDNNYKHRLLPLAMMTSGAMRIRSYHGQSAQTAVEQGNLVLVPIEFSELQVGETVSLRTVTAESGGANGRPYTRMEHEQVFSAGVRLVQPDRIVSVDRVSTVILGVHEAIQELVAEVA